MQRPFKISDNVKYFDKVCYIIGTKEEPYKITVDPLNRKSITTNKDFLLVIQNKDELLGFIEANADELEHIE